MLVPSPGFNFVFFYFKDGSDNDGYRAYVVAFTKSKNYVCLLVVYKGGVWCANGFDAGLSFLLS